MSEDDTPPVPGWPQESAQRLIKTEALRAAGVNPYPTRFERSHRLGEIVAAHGQRTLEELEALAADVRIAGRVLTKRGHGKASFATLGDGDAQLQIYVRSDVVGEQAYRLFDLVDLGDFVGVERHRDAHPHGRAERAGARAHVFSPRRCCPRPRSGTGSPTSRRATASATST